MIDCETYKWGDETDAVGPLGIDYVYMDNCLFPDFHIFMELCMFLWVLLLMVLLANTASDYFSPSLGCICSKLHLAYDVAGVTFLAFGNGAPDFFALVASVSEDIDILVSAGALLGGSMFICTIVVGTIAIVCPCEVASRTFYRDVAFFFIAITWVAVVSYLQYISIYWAFLFIGTYVLYVLVVVLAPYFISGSDSFDKTDGGSGGDIGLTTIDSTTVQTAFWHRDANGKQLKPARVSYNLPGKTDPKSTGKKEGKDPEDGGKGGYTFLILNDDDDEDETKEGKPLTGGTGERGTVNDDEPGIINLSGGFAPEFDLIINEDYYSSDRGGGESGLGEEPSLEQDMSSLTHSRLQQQQQQQNPLHKSLLDAEDEDGDNDGSIGGGRGGGLIGGGDEYGGVDDVSDTESTIGLGTRTYFATSLKERNRKRYQNLLISLYWQQWLLRKHFHRSIFGSEWASYSPWYKIYFLVEYPIVVLRDITIPTLDDSSWYKPYAVLHPIMDALFIAFLSGFLRRSAGPFPVWLVCILAGAAPSAGIYLFTHTSRAPKGRIFSTIWTLTAFVMCVVWIYLLAGELVTCLTALGGIMDIPPAFLGLTVLAWGNSVGDYCTNFSVARQGLGEMAIAGCYGGPVFNILIGLGFALAIGAFKVYPAPYAVGLDRSCTLSLIFLYIAICSTLVIVTIKGFKIERTFGIFLISLYIVYTLCQSVLVLTS